MMKFFLVLWVAGGTPEFRAQVVECDTRAACLAEQGKIAARYMAAHPGDRYAAVNMMLVRSTDTIVNGE